MPGVAGPTLSAAIAAPATLGLRERFASPLTIENIAVVRDGDEHLVRTRSTGGAVGVSAVNNRLEDTLSIFKRRVVPYFQGRDARDIEQLVDGVYVHDDNYKFAGMPFWNAVAHVELSLLDMLGRVEKKSVGRLLGDVLRTEIPVYATRFDRGTSPETEVDAVTGILARTGAKAVKLKIGLKMANRPSQTRRDLAMVALARKRLGDDVAIFVDANGSYTPEEAIAIGGEMHALGVAFLEEPCPWEDYEGTRRVTAALELTIAGGEQDTSLLRLEDMIHRRVVDMIQPDVYYCGGLIRSLRIARWAEKAGLTITPHSPRMRDEALPSLHLASLALSFGPALEYIESPEIKKGRVRVPTAVGLGIEGDPAKWREAKATW